MRLAVAVIAALVLASPALAGGRPTFQGIETKLVCVECHETLDESSSPVAQQMKAEIRRRLAQGWSERQILDEMVANYGPGVLSTPSKNGFDLLAWVLPLGGAAFGVAALAVGARYWARPAPAGPPEPALDLAAERRVDEELDRFDG